VLTAANYRCAKLEQVTPPQCGALQPAWTKFLEYNAVKDTALILINDC
jgi:hypothetical protein